MKYKLLLLLLFISTSKYLAQYKEMLHKPYKDKVDDISVLYRNIVNETTTDSLYVFSYADKMRQWALSNNDLELALEAELLEAYTNWFIHGDKTPKLVQKLINVAQKGNSNKIYHIEERAIQVIATHYWTVKNYESAFEWLLQSAKVLEKMKPENFPDMASHLNYIGRCYYNFEDYTKALTYYKKSSELEKTKFNSARVLEAQSTVGLCYQKLGKLKAAETYFLKVIKDSSQFKSTTWQGIASGNLGYNYYLEGNFEKAIPLLKEDIDNAFKINELRLIAGSAIPLADIYLKQNKLTKAKQKIDQAYFYIQKSKETDRLLKLYPVMSKWYAVKNQPKLSSKYLDSTMLSLDNYNKKYSSLKLLRANQKVEAKERKLELENLNSKNKLKLLNRNYIIALIALLFAASVITLWLRNKYLLNQQQIKEMALISTQKALKDAKNQLLTLTKKIRQDNNLIEILQKESGSEISLNVLSQLKTKNILTPEDWKQFKNIFKEAYPSFFPWIKASYPDLSQAEIRCLCLEKLQLTNNEIGLVLGVSTNTIRVTKHRIRKKLNIESQEELTELIQKIK